MEWLQQDNLSDYFTLEFWTPYVILLLNKSLVLVFVFILTWLALKVRKIVISRIFIFTRLDVKQKNTLESLLLSFTKYVLFIIAMLMCLSNLGLEVGPIIAGAGVLGLAIGFGAQTLVKDLITGFFIIFEDQFSVGDYVTINNGQINGTVVSVGLRATKIRTWAQHVVVIQNSEIKVSQNYNRERMRAIVNVTVPYETDPSEIEKAVHSVSSRLVTQMKHLFLLDDKEQAIEPPQLYGITDVENNALGAKYTVVSLVKDDHYWTACKEIRKALIQELKTSGIHISYPRRVERKDFEIFYNSTP
ncbi:mechanosensitive ion channel family protein [Paenibacillus thermotolerans]|uniref:mechanosensitive ion channel family protein n=1 Tax=Paenibacillus thermotolerans TaxID=3027807 RepID=UPI002367DEED|nr:MULTISPECIES: mechanosensitive ion channel family protein [unclassified Paenibacillus]